MLGSSLNDLAMENENHCLLEYIEFFVRLKYNKNVKKV
jgi:hypothetical protein